MIRVNMTKAKQIHRNIIRGLRQPILEELDIEFMKAVESRNIQKQNEISEKKQRLRDMPANPRINAAVNVDQLKLLTIEELLRD